jgi:hypothetical protein
MASRKEEKERLRVEREAAEAAEARAQRKRLILGYIVAGLISLAVVGGIIFAIVGGGDEGGDGRTGDNSDNVNYEFGGVLPDGVEVDTREGAEPPEVAEEDLQTAADAAGCELQTELEDEGNTHIAPNADTPKYGTSPPTSGDHSPEPLADGAFSTTPPFINSVHTLEHGRIAIQYSPDLSEDEQLALKGLFDADRPGILLFPNPDMPYAVAATAWTQLLGCDAFEGDATLDAIRDFIGTYRGRGPEAIPF